MKMIISGDRNVKTQQQNKKANIKILARTGNRTRDLLTSQSAALHLGQ